MFCEKNEYVIIRKLREINLLIPSKGTVSKETLEAIRHKFHEGEMCCECQLGAQVGGCRTPCIKEAA